MYRINALLKQERKLFHTADLALLWGITNNNTLYTLISRLIKKGVLIPVYKGFYATVPPAKLNPVVLGISSLHQFAYLSCESVLASSGIIFQQSDAITLISGLSRKFSLAGNRYIVRKMKPQYLYQTAGIEDKDDFKQATPARAVADMIYYQPHYHFDNREAVDWREVGKIQKEVGYG